MSRLRRFASRACADARSAAKRDREPDATVDETSGRPGRPTSPTVATGRRVTDDDPPACKAARATSYVVDGESSPAAVVSAARYSVPPTPVLLPLLRFATPVSEPVDIFSSAVPYPCPLVPGDRSSPPCFNLGTLTLSVPGGHVWFPGAQYRTGGTNGCIVCTGVCTSVYGGGGPEIQGVTIFGVQRRNVDHHQPVFTASLTETSGRCGDRGAGRGWVPMLHETSGGGGGATRRRHSRWMSLSWISQWDRVNENLDYNTLDVFPVFPVLPRADGYVPWVSPVSMPDSPADQTLGYLLDEMTGLYSSILGSPVTSRSITSRAEDLHLLSVPLIPLPVEESPTSNRSGSRLLRWSLPRWLSRGRGPLLWRPRQ